jgi:hypothetical protein
LETKEAVVGAEEGVLFQTDVAFNDLYHDIYQWMWFCVVLFQSNIDTGANKN